MLTLWAQITSTLTSCFLSSIVASASGNSQWTREKQSVPSRGYASLPGMPGKYPNGEEYVYNCSELSILTLDSQFFRGKGPRPLAGKYPARVPVSAPGTCIERTKDHTGEEWRRTRKLRSLIRDIEDVMRRIQLASAAFRKLWSLWIRGHLINEQLRVRLYNAYILPVLSYNMGTWGLTSSQLLRIDSFHRRQLRSAIGVRYPQSHQ